MSDSPKEYASKLIHAAKKGLTGEVLRLLRKNELECAAACDKVQTRDHPSCVLYNNVSAFKIMLLVPACLVFKDL